LEQSVIARIQLLTAGSAFGLGGRRYSSLLRCYLYHFRIIMYRKWENDDDHTHANVNLSQI